VKAPPAELQLAAVCVHLHKLPAEVRAMAVDDYMLILEYLKQQEPTE
jgi:hypothetical protein